MTVGMTTRRSDGGRPPRIVIIGAGPTGLGAGYRLQELGHDDWVILEASDRVGGLATSFVDHAGFTHDIGGHVMFSHYPYYDDLVDKLMAGEYTELQREAWVWMQQRFLPYPFQSNIRHLEPCAVLECVQGLIEAQRTPRSDPANFKEWIDSLFGAGIARHFMVPYNFKVWATPAEEMNWVWIGERVATIDTDAVLRNVILGEDQVSWGPNNTFRYPLRGGTGHLWERLREHVDHHLELSCPVVSVDATARVVTTADGRRWPYDHLLSTMPLTDLVASTVEVPADVREASHRLRHSGTHVVAVGLDRPADTTKNWIYFPEAEVPFYRVTYLSNYSPYITPRPDQTLLLTETSFSEHKPEDEATIEARVIDGLEAVGLMEPGDRDRIATVWRHSPARTYPVPSVGRDAALGTIQPWLREHGIRSRGRFGAWLYEIGNMDHSTMQGVEFVDDVLLGRPERTWIPRGEGRAGEGVR